MMKFTNLFLLLVAAATVLTDARSARSLNDPNYIQLIRHDHSVSAEEVNCLSWRLTVETGNLRGWKLVPQSCKEYIADYMLGGQHNADCEAAANDAYDYAKTLNLTGDGKDVWVFDIDQTSLSLLPYYARDDVQFGAIQYNDANFEIWLAGGTAPAVPAVLNLYKKLLGLGIKIVFISGTSESQREIRISNLKGAGYHTWEKLLLKKPSEKGTTAQVYKTKKRAEVIEEGYRIVGNMGDQLSDITGINVGDRTFKLPNPMFYIP